MKSPQETSLQKQTPINKCDSPCDRQKITFTHGKNILKKLNSKCFLLFLFTFFSVGIQAQYSEDKDINNWIIDALAQDHNSTLVSNVDGGFTATGTDWSGTTSSESNGSSSEANMVYNSNGTVASLYAAYMLQGPYFNGTNAFGVSRSFVGNAYTLAPNNGLH